MSTGSAGLRSLQSSAGCEQDKAFPRLSDTVVEKLRGYGFEETVAPGTALFRAGQRDTDMFVILNGTVDIFAMDQDNKRVLVAHKCIREFIGEMDLITSRRTLADGVTQTDCLLLRIPRERLRALLDAEGEIANLIVEAAILRRAAMMRGKVAGLVLIGLESSPATVRLQEFLERNNYPYQFVHAGDQVLSQRAGVSMSVESRLPAVVLPDSRTLYQPTFRAVADEIGLVEPVAPAMLYDLVIVGAGPAGLAAAVYGASEGLSVVVLDCKAPGGQIGTSSRIENYLGFPTGLSGLELAQRSQLQAQKFGARIVISRQVTRITPEAGIYYLALCDGTELRTRAVVIASGATYSRLQLDSYSNYEYQGIHYAATGMEAKLCRGTETIVVGAGNSAGQAALFLSAHAKHVHVLARGDGLNSSMSRYLVSRIERSSNITVHPHAEVTGLSGDSGLNSVTWRTANGTSRALSVKTMFVMIGAKPNSEWLGGCVPLDERGFVLTGTPSSKYGTSLPGVFAVGDIRSGSVKRVAAAAGEGAGVVAEVHAFLAHQSQSALF